MTRSSPALAGPGPNFTGDASVLLVSLSTKPKSMFDQLIGALSDALAAVDTPKCLLHVARALVQHAGWHSNRVFCCQLTVAEILEKVGVRFRSLSSIQRALRILRERGYIRAIDDPGELLGGPGPHRLPEELRESEHRTTTYDIGGLIQLMPEIAEGACTPVAVPGLDNGENVPDPFLEGAGVPTASVSPAIPKSTSHPPRSGEDPPRSGEHPPRKRGEPPGGSAKGAGRMSCRNRENTGYKQTSTNSPEGAYIAKVKNDAYIRGQTESLTASWEKEEQGDEGYARSAPNVKCSHLTESAPAKGLTPEQAAMVERLCKIPQMNRWVAKAYVRRHGIEFIEALLIYGRECGVRDGEIKGGGWYTNTIKNWQRGEGEWPGWLQTRMRIEAETALLRAEASAVAREATPVVTVPPAAAPVVAVPGDEPLPKASIDDVQALEVHVRHELLDRALAAVMNQFAPDSPTVRTVRKNGHRSGTVLAHAAEMLTQQWREQRARDVRAGSDIGEVAGDGSPP